MNGIFLLILAIAGNLYLASRTFAQPAVEYQVRHVKGQVLYSAGLPPIQLWFAKSCSFAGSQEVTLFDRARAEQFFFVEAGAQGQIKRLYMVQFEGFFPGIEGVYDYPDTHAVLLAGQRYLADAGAVPDVEDALAEHPQSDMAQAASFLKSKGYSIGGAIAYQRYRRAVDETRRHELIVLYIETLGAEAGVGQEEALQALSSRALNGFAVLK